MEEQEQNCECEAPPGHVRAGVTYNLKRNAVTEPQDAEAEFDDYNTILAIKNALEESGCSTALYPADELLPERLARDRPDIIFNIAEGMNGRGREAQVPAILSYLSIPFTGSDETAMCIAMDKSLTKSLLSAHRVSTPKFKIIESANRVSLRGMDFPVIIKPNAEGSGKGISSHSVARDAKTLKRFLAEALLVYKQDMLVEEYIPGREFTVGILGNGPGARVFLPMEIIFKDKEHPIYSYEVKQRFREYVDYKCPPDISSEKQAEIMGLAAKIFKILKCQDCARIDFRMDSDGRFYFIEINPLPGLAPGYSDYPMLAEFCGVGYNDMIRGIMNSALERYGLPLVRQRR